MQLLFNPPILIFQGGRTAFAIAEASGKEDLRVFIKEFIEVIFFTVISQLYGQYLNMILEWEHSTARKSSRG